VTSQNIKRHEASRGLSVTAELLVCFTGFSDNFICSRILKGGSETESSVLTGHILKHSTSICIISGD